MTEDAPLTPQEEDEALAAEMALGLLDGDDLTAAKTRMAEDAEFARTVRDWHERLAGMAENLTPVMAPARARHAIRERLGHASPPLANDPTERRAWWRGPMGAFGGLLGAAALAFLFIMPGQDPTPQPGFQAQLQVQDSEMRVAARLTGREMEIAMEGGTPPADRDLEIWWIKPDGSAPISIGLVPRDGNMRMTLPEGLDPAENVKIALSDEPLGGSPTGQATGPVVAISDLTRS